MTRPTYLTFRNRLVSQLLTIQFVHQAWTKTAADPFRLYGNYLLMIDYYSKFIIIETLGNLQSSTVISVRNVFHNLGPQRS